MSLYGNRDRLFNFEETKTDKRAPPTELYKNGCKSCPLDSAASYLQHPKMVPSGSNYPVIYTIGEAPGCISGDALIDVAYRDKNLHPEGVRIDALVGQSDFYVYSFDIERQVITLGKVKRVWKTGTKQVFRVTYEWSYTQKKEKIYKTDSIKVTANHPFLLKKYIPHDPFGSGKDRQGITYLSIEQGLRCGDGIQPILRHRKFGYSFVGTSHKNMSREGRFLLANKLERELIKGEDCHHKNENKLNDTWDNLVLLTTVEHARQHILDNNPMNSVSARENHKKALSRPEYREGQREVQYRYLSIPENYEKRAQQVQEAGTDTRFKKGHNRHTSDNHRIIAIEPLGIEDVYDMEVEEYHNFAVNGIFVHNSQEDQEGKQFVGSSGHLLRSHIPEGFLDFIRWTNTIHCRPPENRNPTHDEMEFCRSRVVSDIEKTQPEFIFGFGGVPLSWAGRSGIGTWRGRYFPLQVGTHKLWYFAFHHPAFLLHLQHQNNGRPSNFELSFKLDMERAFRIVEDGLPEPVIHSVEDAKAGIATITGREQNALSTVVDFLKEAAKSEICGLDYETQGLRPYGRDAAILTIAVALPDRCLSFALDHPQAGWSATDRIVIKDEFKKFLLAPVRKCVHSLHFEMEWSAFFFGREIAYRSHGNRFPWEDSLTQAFILDERKEGFSLDFLAHLYFGINIKKITGNLNKNNMREEPLMRLLPYNGIDAKYHLLTFQAQDRLLEQQGLQAAYQEKLRQVPTCVLTQLAGLPVDYDENVRQQHEMRRKIEAIETELFMLPAVKEYQHQTGNKFNPGSDKDVKYLIQKILGHYDAATTDKSVLDKLDHPFGKLEINWRHYSKMLSTYIERFNEENAYPDHLYHVSLGTVFTDTGRLNGDFQNVPKRGEEASTRRQIAGKGVFASFDYGQIEARVIACASQDPAYCKATWDGLDVHGYWAKRIAQRYPQTIGGKKYLSDPAAMKKLRDRVKNKFVFPLFFSASLHSVAGYMDIPDDILAPEHDLFWQEYKGVKEWQQTLINGYQQSGYTACLNGRRRRAPLGLGQVVNSLVQGSAADIVMDGMNRLSETCDPLLQPRLQIHDDLLFYFESEEQLQDNVDKIINAMLDIQFPWVIVPLTVEMSIGPNWYEMKEVGTYDSHKLLGLPTRQARFL
jgi:uracil-DNA glycosylase family 4